jgi:hypothetical protein
LTLDLIIRCWRNVRQGPPFVFSTVDFVHTSTRGWSRKEEFARMGGWSFQ